MKAWVLHGVNELCPEDVPMPSPGKQEVVVKVKAAGICGSDIPRIYRTGAHTHPLIPGHEFSGEVVEVGKEADRKWLGQRVGIFPLLPCKECGPCRKKQYEMCKNYSYLGSRRDGGFAEYAAVPVWNLLPLPKEVSFEVAAMLEPMAVAVHAIRQMMPEKSLSRETEARGTIAVCGLGTIGLLLVMFLKEAGFDRVFAIGNKEIQKTMALKLGVREEDYLDSRTQKPYEWLMERTGGGGVDRFFECVGKNETCALAVKSSAPAGKVTLVGNPGSDMTLEKDVYWKILRNQLTVTGTWNSSFFHEPEDDWNYVMERLSAGRISPEKLISHRFSLENLDRGLRIMRDKTEEYVKIMGRVGSDFPGVKDGLSSFRTIDYWTK